MNPICHRPLLRLALIGALVASLGLAACGRKGPLDPPPGASLAGDQIWPRLETQIYSRSRRQAARSGGSE